ncbi:MAG: response regulator transcription factor [Rhodanobacteraceae bacterium]
MYRIILVDDHSIVREGFRALIERERDLGIVAECDSLFEMEAALGSFEPDLMVLDLSLPDGGGLARIPKLRNEYPDLRVIVLSMHEGEPYLSEALARGADGYVSKGAAADELVTAIRAVLAGNVYLSSDLASARPRDRPDLLAQLSEREREVFSLLARGLVPKQIAAELGIGLKTTYVHRAKVLEKLGVRNEVELYRMAVESGVLPDDSGS